MQGKLNHEKPRKNCKSTVKYYTNPTQKNKSIGLNSSVDRPLSPSVFVFLPFLFSLLSPIFKHLFIVVLIIIIINNKIWYFFFKKIFTLQEELHDLKGRAKLKVSILRCQKVLVHCYGAIILGQHGFSVFVSTDLIQWTSWDFCISDIHYEKKIQLDYDGFRILTLVALTL